MPASQDGLTSLLDISRRALYVQSQSLRVISNNIANVNTEGYTRRRVDLQTIIGASDDTNVFGAGADIAGVTRIVDRFVNDALEQRISERSEADVRDQLLARVELMFGLQGNPGQIGTELNAFFDSLDTLATNPASSQLRDQVILRGESLVRAVRSTYDLIAQAQREADTRLAGAVTDLNGITERIAQLNGQIAGGEIGNQENLALRDQRDLLLRDLSELVSYSKVEDSQGQLLISLQSGFALVQGTSSNALDFTYAPSFGNYPVGLDSRGLGTIVFDFDPSATQAHGDLMQTLAAGSGEIAGLINIRGLQSSTDTSPFDASGDLVNIASRIESIARELLTTFNQVYRGDDPDTVAIEDEDASTAAVIDARSGDLNGNGPGVFGLFTYSGIAGSGDSDADGLAENADLTATGIPVFASRLAFAISDTSSLAAALDLDAADASTDFAQGDASNIQNLLKLRTQNASVTVGSFTPSASISTIFEQTSSMVGSLKRVEENNVQIFTAREEQIRQFYDSVSGVSIDEEFANLIDTQRAYEASARLLRVGDELISQILQLLG